MTKDFNRFYLSKRMFLGVTMLLTSVGLASANPGIEIPVSDALVASPQQAKKKVTGTVEDALGPIAGANVVEKGTTNGTITDMDGKFNLEVSPNAVLVITFIGYTEQQVSVGSQTSFTIKLKEDSQALDEVVVVGYGTQKKVNLTGSVASVSAEKIANRPVMNLGLQVYALLKEVVTLVTKVSVSRCVAKVHSTIVAHWYWSMVLLLIWLR